MRRAPALLALLLLVAAFPLAAASTVPRCESGGATTTAACDGQSGRCGYTQLAAGTIVAHRCAYDTERVTCVSAGATWCEYHGDVNGVFLDGILLGWSMMRGHCSTHVVGVEAGCPAGGPPGPGGVPLAWGHVLP